jgi:hypothetical protein
MDPDRLFAFHTLIGIGLAVATIALVVALGALGDLWFLALFVHHLTSR